MDKKDRNHIEVGTDFLYIQTILKMLVLETNANVSLKSIIDTITNLKHAQVLLEKKVHHVDCLLEETELQAVHAIRTFSDYYSLVEVIGLKHQTAMTVAKKNCFPQEYRALTNPKEAIYLAKQTILSKEQRKDVLLKGARLCTDFISCKRYYGDVLKNNLASERVLDSILKRSLLFLYSVENCMWVYATSKKSEIKDSAMQRAIFLENNLEKLVRLHELNMSQENVERIVSKFNALCTVRQRFLIREKNFSGTLFLYKISSLFGSKVDEVKQTLSVIVESSISADQKSIDDLLRMLSTMPKEIKVWEKLALFTLEKTKSRKSIQKILKLSEHCISVQSACVVKLKELH